MQQKYDAVKNKDNNGRLLDERGIPFWSARSKEAKEVISKKKPLAYLTSHNLIYWKPIGVRCIVRQIYYMQIFIIS